MSDEYRSRQERRKAQTQAKTKNKKTAGKGSLFKKIFLALCIVIGLGIIGGGIAVYAIIQNAPELKPALLDSPLTTTIYDKDNEQVKTVFGDQNRVKVNIENVPKTLKQAFVSIEDRRFYEHFGIDIRRIVGAAIEDIQEMAIVEGGSTITQQVVKRAILSPKQTFVRKIQEAWLAIQLEQKYTKDQILEMYINKIYFGSGAHGVKTASIEYFGIKDLSKLNISQMALLAGLPNAPSAYNPFEHPEKAAERRNIVLHAMVETGAITEEQAQKASSKPVTKLLAKKNKDSNTTPYYSGFIEEVYNELVKEKKVISRDQFYQGGLKIYTTLDTNAQERVYNLLKSDEIPYPDKYFEAGIALVDTQSGAVRAIGGGRDFSLGGFNYGSESKNQPGSNIKPVLDYGPAVEYLKWSTYHQIVDEPYKYPGTDKSVGEWDGDYWGKMSIRRALAWSRNVPAVKTFVQATQEAGKEKVMDFARNIGVPIEQFHYSAALGAGIQVSPLQMAGAYATFGNQGVHHEPYTVRKIVFPNGKTIKFDHKPEVTMHKYTAYMVTDMLKTVLNKGTGQLADIPGLPVAGKTGSTQIPDDIAEKYNIQEDGYLDEWFTGYTSQYAISVWTGYPGIDVNDDGEAEFISFDNLEENPNLDSTDLAKLIFKKLMMDISGEDVPDWEMPDNVVKVAVEEDTGLLPSENTPEDQIVTELFVEGTQPTKVSNKYKKLETPKNLEAQYDKKKKQIIVTWDYPEKQKNIGFEVSYSVDGQSMQKQGKVGKTKFIVNNPTPGSVYEFQVKAVNSETKKESDPVTTSVEIPEEEVALVPPQQLTAKYDKKTDQILLTWSYPERENTVFKINGSVNGQPLQSLGSTEQTQVVIKNPQPNSVYQFQIIAVDSETGQTGPPAETAVRIPKEKPQGPPEPPPGQDDSDGSTEPPGSTGDDTGTNTGTNTGTDTGTEDQGDENTGDDDNVSGETNDNGGNDSGTQTNDDQTNENNDGSVSGKENEDDPSSPVPGLP